MTFEQNLKKLEQIADKMEDKDTSLDEGLKLFDEGVKSARGSHKKLEESAGKVTELSEGLEKLRVTDGGDGG